MLVAIRCAPWSKKCGGPDSDDGLVYEFRAWFDLAAGYPPAVIHREYFHSGGAFRVGPALPEFEDLIGRSVVETDPGKLGDLGKRLDGLVYEEALNVFLCCPQALVAVNRHVDFTGHAATLELAETEVGEGHWSRQNG